MNKFAKKYFYGKVDDFSGYKGWFFGQFADKELLKSNLFEVAWQKISNKKISPEDKHYHKQCIEISIVISGTMRIKVNSKELSVSKGEFLVIYPYTIVENCEADENTELIVIKSPSLPSDKFRDESL